MQSEFDKEIDSLLREGARRGRAVVYAEDGEGVRSTSSGAHLDTDERNAYAENSLPAAARTHYAAHLADCDDCRRSVTQLALAAGTPAQLEQQASATAATAQKVLPNVTWRERLGALFAPRAWRYAVPALALLLVGAVALMVLTRRSGQRDATIAQRNTSEQTRPAATATETHHAPQNNSNATNAAAAQQSELNASNSNATQAKEEIAANTVERAGAATQQPVTGAVVSADAPPPPPAPSTAGSTAVAPVISQMPTPAPTPAPVSEAVTITSAPEAKVKNVEPAGEVAKDAQRTGNFENRQQQQPRERISGPRRNEQSRNIQRGINTEILRDDADRNDAAIAASKPKPAPPAATAAARRAPEREADGERNARASDDAKKSEGMASSKSAAETRTVAGRKFRRQGRAWVDTAYNSSQATTSVRRNSEQYRALIADEPELRRISDALGGEVTIVWKGRAYRIR